MRTFILILTAVIISGWCGQGQAYVLPEPDAASAGLGGAYTAKVSGPAAVYWNAAALGDLLEPQFQTMKKSLLFGDTFTSFSYAQPVGSIKIGLQERRLTLKSLEERDSHGVLRSLFQEDYLDRAIAAAYPFRKGFCLGATYHQWTRTVGFRKVRAHSIDLSGQWRIQDNLRLALVFGGLISRASGHQDIIGPAPASFTRIGIGWEVLKASLSLDLEQFDQRRADISFGLEVPYRNLLFFRAGHREEDWTLGMGLKLGCTMFDLGFQDKKPGSQTVLSTTWSFGGLTGLKKLGGWLKGLTAPPPEAKHRLETPTGAPSPDRLPLPAGEFVTMPSELVTESPADLLARAKLAFLSGDLFEAERLCREIGNSDNEEIKGYVSNLLEQIEQVKLINDVKKLSVTR